ncbi:MAG: hypothetical protein HYS81_01725 [Candidatus Aenigmatarchaeota archaeon]|nr:MAG: hypothetical protein HYS81_01725 [Candidatus Aenigmarchaeota archaeon]
MEGHGRITAREAILSPKPIGVCEDDVNVGTFELLGTAETVIRRGLAEFEKTIAEYGSALAESKDYSGLQKKLIGQQRAIDMILDEHKTLARDQSFETLGKLTSRYDELGMTLLGMEVVYEHTHPEFFTSFDKRYNEDPAFRARFDCQRIKNEVETIPAFDHKDPAFA